jgi:ribonuclease D
MTYGEKMKYLRNLQNLFDSRAIFEDYFGPCDEECIRLPLPEKHVYFIRSIEYFQKKFVHLRKSKVIAIDTEWIPDTNGVQKGISIMQLADEKRVYILDILSLSSVNKFYEILEKKLKNKIILGFNFTSDFNMMDEKFRKVFSSLEMLNLAAIYQDKFNKKCPGLKALCEEVLGQKLCKYCQCSNWELRPLHKRQIHYAALDAYSLLMIYKKIK